MQTRRKNTTTLKCGRHEEHISRMKTLHASLILIPVVLNGCSQREAPDVDVEPVPVAPHESATDESPYLVEEDGFTILSLDDFVEFPSHTDAWREEDGVLICSGDPRGYLHSSKPYENFTLRAEYRFAPLDDGAEKPAEPNTGFMIHIQEPHKIWPVSLEVQGKHSEMCSIKANGGAAELTIDDFPEGREAARLPVGDWNAVEIVSIDGALIARLNGANVCSSEPGELSSGMIGLQSEGFEVQFRNLRIREN